MSDPPTGGTRLGLCSLPDWTALIARVVSDPNALVRRSASVSTRRAVTVLADFPELGLSAPILGALTAEGYSEPTPIQIQAIPPILSGRDLCGIAQTGTGKTAAFALPILQRLGAVPRRPAPRTCRALVLGPTRELASQIADRFRAYGTGMPLSTAVVFGGVPIGPQRRQLARPSRSQRGRWAMKRRSSTGTGTSAMARARPVRAPHMPIRPLRTTSSDSPCKAWTARAPSSSFR